MLKVTDDGVTITLASTLPNASSVSNRLTQILWVAIALAVIGILMAFAVIPAMIGAVLILIVIIASYAWQRLQPKKTAPILSGGELRLNQRGFSHHNGIQSTTYEFLDTDTIEPTAQGLSVRNTSGQTLYHIQGFNDPKHVQIAQAVIQGKYIKTQGKAIKLQSS